MLATLLENTGDTGASGTTGGGLGQNIIMFVILGVLIVALVVFYFLSNRKRKKQEQEAKDLINAVKPGNKVKTIGGICGIVVEVDPEENTFVLETGTATTGKSYVKFDRQAIYQTDAVVDKSAAKADEKTVGEETAEETVVEEANVAETATVVTDNAETVEIAEATEVAEEQSAEQPAMVKSKKKNKKTDE